MKKIKEWIKSEIEDIKWFFQDLKSDIKTLGFWRALYYKLDRFYMIVIGRTIRKLTRIVQWIPVLWKDNDWDYIHILRVLDYKLKRTRKEIANGHGSVEEWVHPRCAEIDEIRAIIASIDENDFAKAERAAHVEKYGEMKAVGLDTDQTYLKRLNFTFEKCDTPELTQEADDELQKIHALEDQRETDAYTKLFELLNKNIRRFWD